MTSNNPLQQFFRQPSIYLKLPSAGKFWTPGSINLPENGELPVLPMTAIDEITYRTPDALFNGSAVVTVIQSCIPNILNAWAVPITDLDAILVAIRIASYGHELELTTECPSCKDENTYGIDLRQIIDRFKSVDYSKTIKHGDLEISFKSMTYKDANDANIKSFEHEKTMQASNAPNISNEEKLKIISESFQRIVVNTVNILSQSIESVRIPQALVTESIFIQELLTNCDRQLFERIKDHVIKLKQDSELKPIDISCAACKHEYTQPFTLDLASFFATAS